jgi:hypothetical protein
VKTLFALFLLLFHLSLAAQTDIVAGGGECKVNGDPDLHPVLGDASLNNCWLAVDINTGEKYRYNPLGTLGDRWDVFPNENVSSFDNSGSGGSVINSADALSPQVYIGLQLALDQVAGDRIYLSGIASFQTTIGATDNSIVIRARIQKSTDSGATWEYVDGQQVSYTSENLIGWRSVPVQWSYLTTDTGNVLYRLVSYKSTLTNDGQTSIVYSGSNLYGTVSKL